MIHKLYILLENKLVLNKFSINLNHNKITINSIECKDTIIKIPVYNKFNGIKYIPITIPLELPIYQNIIINPYMILSSYNISNEIDFFGSLSEFIDKNFNLKFKSFEQFVNDKPNTLIKIMNDYYSNNVNNENISFDNLNATVTNLYFNLNITKLACLYVLIKYPNICNKLIKELNKNPPDKINIPKKILQLANQIKNLKYNLTESQNEYKMSFNEYYAFNFDSSLKLTDIKPQTNYYLVINKKEENMTATEFISSTQPINKIIKILVNKVNKNIIEIDQNKNIIFENYKWYYYHPNTSIKKSYVIFNTFNNINFTNEILKNMLNIDDVHTKKVLDYYYNENYSSNLLSLALVFPELASWFEDMNILKSGSFSDGFFEFITKKYSSNNDPKIFEILNILFGNYSYPLKSNRHDLDVTFDYILYFSLYNYKTLLINSKISNNSSELLHPNINDLIPVKLKNLYINLLKSLSQMINNEFESITYNQKYYSDYLHRNIIKLFFTDSTRLSINLFKSLMKPTLFDKFKNIVTTNILLIDIGSKLNWSNIPKKLNYLNFFYKNSEIVHYQDKINRNIMPENFDHRIKKIIENPFEMFKYLRKEKDFIKWTRFISDKIIQIYYVPISLSSEDFNLIGKLIYLLFNINEQNTKDETYISFINFCNLNNKLVLDTNRINLKIRECFPNLKSNINLGILAKHLTWNKEAITFEEPKQEKSPDVLALEMKLHIATKKYYKYKAKYLESKDIDVKSLVPFNQNKMNFSDTSSIMPSNNTINFIDE
jgi:hypothetical protein